jgi:hypothetical protein
MAGALFSRHGGRPDLARAFKRSVLIPQARVLCSILLVSCSIQRVFCSIMRVLCSILRVFCSILLVLAQQFTKKRKGVRVGRREAELKWLRRGVWCGAVTQGNRA